MATGSLAGNVAFRASSSSSSKCAIAAGRGLCRGFGVSMIVEPFAFSNKTGVESAAPWHDACGQRRPGRDHLELGRELNREIACLLAAQDAIHVGGGTTKA